MTLTGAALTIAVVLFVVLSVVAGIALAHFLFAAARGPKTRDHPPIKPEHR